MRQRSGRRGQSDDSSLPNLTVARAEAERHLKDRIDQGKRLQDRFKGHSAAAKIMFGRPQATFEELKEEYRKWNDFNVDLLKRFFDRSNVSKEYAYDIDVQVGRSEMESVRSNLGKKILHLQSLLDRLALYQEPGYVQAATHPEPDATCPGNEIFLVHGHNVAVKEETARYLERLGLKVVILHEQPNRSRTLIEKFEDYSSVGFAVVLLTPDDIGGPAPTTSDDQPTKSHRARQNVIFELGYFIGKLGREKVCALYAHGVELPTDMNGVLYVPLDDKGAWKMLLARELKTAGIDIDLNKAV